VANFPHFIKRRKPMTGGYGYGGLVALGVLIFYLLYVLLLLVLTPAVRKAGFSGWWVMLALLPPIGIVLLWIFAFAKWPAYPDR